MHVHDVCCCPLVLEGLVGTGYLGLVACVGKGKHSAARLYCPVALARYVLYPGWACQPINVPRSKNFYFILLGGKRKAFASPFLLPSWMAQQGIMYAADFIRYIQYTLLYLHCNVQHALCIWRKKKSCPFP